MLNVVSPLQIELRDVSSSSDGNKIFDERKSSTENFVTLNEHSLQSTSKRSRQIANRWRTICNKFMQWIFEHLADAVSYYPFYISQWKLKFHTCQLELSNRFLIAPMFFSETI